MNSSHVDFSRFPQSVHDCCCEISFRVWYAFDHNDLASRFVECSQRREEPVRNTLHIWAETHGPDFVSDLVFAIEVARMPRHQHEPSIHVIIDFDQIHQRQVEEIRPAPRPHDPKLQVLVVNVFLFYSCADGRFCKARFE
jgi:hypothetical protein